MTHFRLVWVGVVRTETDQQSVPHPLFERFGRCENNRRPCRASVPCDDPL